MRAVPPFPCANSSNDERAGAWAVSNVCIVVFMCSRLRSNTNAKLLGVYQDRIPRWSSTRYPLYIVDSCNETLSKPFTIPGATTLSFQGQTSEWCSWQCPTNRETAALEFASQHLPSTCEFLFKVTGKYYTPHLEPQIDKVPQTTQLALQHAGMASEIFGISRKALKMFLSRYGNARYNQETRLYKFAKHVCPRVHRLSIMPLSNFTRRSDGHVLREL